MAITAMLDRTAVERIVREIVLGAGGAGANGKAATWPNLVVSISARHVHLTDEDVETLFGPGHRTAGFGKAEGRETDR